MAQRMDVQYIRLYTNGSAALKLESAVPQTNTAFHKKAGKIKRVKVFVDPVALLSIGIAICMVVLMSVGFAQLHQARAQVEAMESYVDRLQAENATLSNEYRTGYNLDQIRQAALELQMIPAEQAAHVSLFIPAEPEPIQQVTLWERISTFLTGLFA